jgi:uncharacterized damage-inducible protein DinB
MKPRHLASHIARAFTGPMWHGPAVHAVLEDITPEQAAARPIPGAHSIWELVLHMSVWAELATARLRGEALESPAPEDDWPAPPAPSPDAWAAAVRKLGDAHARLARAVEGLADEQLRAPVAGQDHPTWAMLHGVVEHACYHAGQVPVLKKALSQGPAA